jgi:hypothetical protein
VFLIVCFPPLFSVFSKPFLAFPKIAHLVLKVQQNQKSYFVCPFLIGLLRNRCASPFGQSKALACWQQVFVLVFFLKTGINT